MKDMALKRLVSVKNWKIGSTRISKHLKKNRQYRID